MSAKEQRLDRNELSELMARLYSLYERAVLMYDETGLEPLFFKDRLFVSDEVVARDYGLGLGKDGDPFWTIPWKLAGIYTQFLRRVMVQMALKTARTRIEYLLIVLKDGNFFVLEGEEDRVIAPYPEGVAGAHTHPDVCLMSHKDLETADRAFLMSYFASAVVSPSCLYMIYRNGPNDGGGQASVTFYG